MSKLVVKDLEGPSSSSNKIYIASGSTLDLKNSSGTTVLPDIAAGDIASGTLNQARLPNGPALQHKYVFSSIFSSSTSTSYVTRCSVTLTPTEAGNIIFLIGNSSGYNNINTQVTASVITVGTSGAISNLASTSGGMGSTIDHMNRQYYASGDDWAIGGGSVHGWFIAQDSTTALTFNFCNKSTTSDAFYTYHAQLIAWEVKA